MRLYRINKYQICQDNMIQKLFIGIARVRTFIHAYIKILNMCAAIVIYVCMGALHTHLYSYVPGQGGLGCFKNVWVYFVHLFN